MPSFMAVPGNQTVTLSWDDVPLAESYAVRYADTGRVPTQTSGILVDNASSPLTITGLDNGGEYSFLLEARHDAESSSWSEIEQTIPLSTATLVPQASAGFGRITVNWQGIEGADEYELFRATSPGGQYTQLTGARASTSFTDFDVVDGTRYFYAVRPAGQTRILSGPAASETTPFPESAVELVSSQLGIFNTGQSIAIDGDYAYVGEFGAFFTSFADLRIYDITIPRSPVELSRLNVHGSSSTSRIRDVEVSGTTVSLTS
ncbi:MAG TPA: fibronectin type III domain-containing protein, partial [Spirochaetia bacterium]|nr:fibronectin type III domain-containing protein [Spirochaetia bacterium]